MQRQKMRLFRLILGSVLFTCALVIKPSNNLLRLSLFLIPYFIIGGDVLLSAIQNIFKGNMLDENFLMCIATIGAFAIGEYPEGVAVMLFYQVGELFQSYAVNKSRKSISELMDIRPDYANVKDEHGTIQTVDPYDVSVGDLIVIKAGEKVPLDAKVVEGTSSLDTSALTGESLPREVSVGDLILSGSINHNGLLTAEVLKEFGDSTVSKILDLVENATSKKSKSENFITKFARYYTPAVVAIAALLAFLPPLFIEGAQLSDWGYRALTFLVISCPCALVISIPMSFFGGIGGASRCGILVKGSNYLEALARTDTVVFDKTGTLTQGVFQVQDMQCANGFLKEEVLEAAALAEAYSSHPISLSLRQSYGKDIDDARIAQVEEIPGHGIVAMVDARPVAVGNTRLMEQKSIPFITYDGAGTIVHVAISNQYAGYIVIADQVKKDAKDAISRLLAQNVHELVMLTGDNQKAGKAVAEALGIPTVYTELLPGDKVSKVEALLAKQTGKRTLAFVGDGINDAPVLARADVGIAMGGLGSDAAIEAADVVIMTDEPSKIPVAIAIARKTLGIATQNIVFALGIKVFVLILGAAGLASMWAAVFADVGVSVLAILNAMRALNTKGLQ